MADGIHGEVIAELGVIDWFTDGMRIGKTVHHHLLPWSTAINDEDPESPK